MHTWRVLFRVWRRTTQEDFRQKRDLQDVPYEICAYSADEAVRAAWSRKETEWPLLHWTAELLCLIRDDVTEEQLANLRKA